MGLNTIQDIEEAIRGLNPEQLEELYTCLDENYPQAIDDRIAADLAAGRLDNVIQAAIDDEKNGRTSPL